MKKLEKEKQSGIDIRQIAEQADALIDIEYYVLNALTKHGINSYTIIERLCCELYKRNQTVKGHFDTLEVIARKEIRKTCNNGISD